MALLNYSTTVSVLKTVGEIQEMLAQHGASSILLRYEAREPVAVEFLLSGPLGEFGYRLPAKVDAVWQTLVSQHQRGTVPRRFVTREQAARVGWRIVKGWLQAQLAIIETGMVTFEQCMLPYMRTTAGGTVYEDMVEGRLLLPPGREGQAEL